jgi:hypothetical protein
MAQTVHQKFGEIQVNLPGVSKVFARGTGAGAANLTSVKGVTSIAETATGKYTVTLDRKYKGLLMVTGIIIDPSSVDDWEVTLESDLTSNQTFGILVTKSGTAADLTTDEKLLLEITLQDTAGLPAGY